ncbi:Uu.00g047490.m01.CDS01 [Anthostomella pinea]|uniref:Uu.00g047490.m01.CDS01 n=1 Tax=Anthostomella pinea TaxID=933095 RepID=A0AAI8VCJ3_9PEZI|nr:Uu.00g047490.m01.CDS01 [Anthostomella pinea]
MRPRPSTSAVPTMSSATQPLNMQYRSRSVAVAVDPVSLVISECISVTSVMRKHARWAGSSVSSILGGNPNPVQLGPPSPLLRPGSRASTTSMGADGVQDFGLANRWGLRGKKGKSMQDNPLMAGFGRLRHELSSCKGRVPFNTLGVEMTVMTANKGLDIHEFDAPTLLNPFLQVIQASSTSAPITILALKAIRKFLSYGFISPDSPRFPLAMQSLSTAVTHCRFEASDSAQDEVVLLMILHLMEDMLSGPGGALLSDESVCELMETGLTMCCQSRLSELLRRTAEAAMVRMTQIIFEHLKHLEVEAGDDLEALDQQANGDMAVVRMVPSTNGNNVIASTDAPVDEPRTSSSLENTVNGMEESSVTEVSEVEEELLEIKPYSLPSMKELFRVLVDLLDPHEKQQGDTMRVMALRIIHVALEVAGPSIARHPALAVVAEDRLCRHLFQLVRSDNMAILQESLIVAGTLLETCRGVLKLQQELFISYLVTCLHPPVEIPREPNIDPSLYDGIPQRPTVAKPAASQPGSGRATPVPVRDRQRLGLEGGARKPDARQAMVESVGALTRMPSFLVELFVNYDCDANRGNLCQDMIGLLSRSALPDSATWSTTSVPPLCLDALLGYIQFITDRLDDEPVTDGLPDQDKLRAQRRRKNVIIKGAIKFNEKPKDGLGYLKEQGILGGDPVSAAAFLRGTSRVSKAVIGEFLSKKGNDEYLEAFMNLFDFAGKRVDEALRQLLENFRLPGESPLIERIVTAFAKKYFTTSTGIENEDAIFVLTYAIIMLNVDQHSPKLRNQKRMELVDFERQLRGVNGDKNFDPEFVQATFEAIRTNEIILPDEHDNKHAFDYAWRELLLKTESAGPLIPCHTNIYDADMFATTWKPIVSTLSYVFMSATDDAVFSRVVTGFDQCARIASKYQTMEALDRIIKNLSYMTTLDTDSLFNTSLNTEVKVSDDGDSVMVSELAVKLGRDFKAQLATLVLFRVVKGSEHMIHHGWEHIVRIWLKLFVNSLIPSFFSNDQEGLKLPKIPLHTPSQVIDRAAKTVDTGLFSALSSYISSYAADDPPEPSAEEIESSLSTADCIKACDLESVFANITSIPVNSLTPLVEALLNELPDDESSTVPVITVKPEGIPSSPGSGTSKPSSKKPTYDPSIVYILEFCNVLALRDRQATELLGKTVAEALQAVLRDSSRYHPVLVSRAAYYQFNMLKASYDHDFVRAPVLLHTISNFTKETVAKTSQLVLQGLKLCIEQPGPLRSEIMTSPDFWLILRTLAGNPNSSPTVFEILEGGVSGSPSAIIADNYEAAIALLNEFATAAKVGAVVEQKGERRQRNTRPPKKDTPSENAVVSRGVKAINLISSMTARIPHLMNQSHLASSEGWVIIPLPHLTVSNSLTAWSAYWLPIFQALTTQCTNPCREVRHLAFSSLQRSLLSPELTCSDHEEWTAIFGEVLFPLILRLLKPEVYSSDRDGMSETRVQAASLLCKTFLQYLVLLSKWDGMLDLWLQIIDIMDRLMNSGQGDSLEEAVPENLKNVLLFMASSGYLVPPSKDSSQESLWVETWKRIDRFLPDLRNELALEEPETLGEARSQPETEWVPAESQLAPESKPVEEPHVEGEEQQTKQEHEAEKEPIAAA